MARNVNAIHAERREQGSGLEPENPPVPLFSNTSNGKQKRTITPLHKLLACVPLEDTLASLHGLNLSFSVCVDEKGVWRASLRGPGTFHYYTGGARSPQTALANVLVQFFTHEQRDIHDYPKMRTRSLPTAEEADERCEQLAEEL